MSESNANTPQVPVVPQYVGTRPINPEIWATSGVPTQRGTELVKVSVHAPYGQLDHYMDPETAITIGKQIAEQGRKSLLARHVIGPDGQVLG